MTFRTEKFITRHMVRANRDTLFVFGDNLAEIGHGGQAKEMRGEPNSVGIPTKWYPAMEDDAFFKESDLHIVKGYIEAQFKLLAMQLAKGGDVVWPEDGIGTGLARLRERAPSIFAIIVAGRSRLEVMGDQP